jgi:hypothetical protein
MTTVPNTIIGPTAPSSTQLTNSSSKTSQNVPRPRSNRNRSSRSLGGRATRSPTTPAPTSHPPQAGTPGTMALQITPTTANTAAGEATGVGSMNENDNPLVYTHEYETTWQGKRYKLTIEVPLAKPKDKMSPAQLKIAGDRFAAIFLEDLKKNLASPSCPIKPGNNFCILFGKEGYTAFIPKDEVDPDSCTTAELLTKCPGIPVASPEAKELSKILDSKNPLKFNEQLSKSSTLANYKKTIEASKSTEFRPVNLKNPGVRCFINSPFQQLITNPALREELLNPDHFIGGSFNPLYRAVQGYVEHQASGSNEPFDLGYDLALNMGIDERIQDDADQTWNCFSNQFELTKLSLNSPLRALFENKLTISPGSSNTGIWQLLQNKINDPTSTATWASPPTSFSAYVGGRVNIKTQPLTAISNEKKLELIDLLNNHAMNAKKEMQNLTQFCKANRIKIGNITTFKDYSSLREALDETQNPNKREYITILDRVYHLKDFKEKLNSAYKTTIADEILQTDLWNKACRILTIQERADLQKDRSVEITKNSDPIPVELTTTLKANDGTEATYDLMSFSHHIGNSGTAGHYISYTRIGKDFWSIDDLGPCKKISQDEFLRAAQTASLFVFNRQGTSESLESISSAPAKKSNALIKKESIQDTRTTLIQEEGSLSAAGSEFAFVNPTDTLLNTIHPELSEHESIIRANVDAVKKKKAKRWILPDKDKVIYSTGQHLIKDFEPDVEESAGLGSDRGILHVVLPTLGEELDATKIQKSIQKSVDAVLNKALALKPPIQKVAFPLNLYPQLADDLAFNYLKNAIENYAKAKQAKVTPLLEVKIVQPKKLQASSIAASTSSPASPKTPAQPPEKPSAENLKTQATTVTTNQFELSPWTTLVVEQSSKEIADQGVSSTPLDFQQHLKTAFDTANDTPNCETVIFDLTDTENNSLEISTDNKTVTVPCNYQKYSDEHKKPDSIALDDFVEKLKEFINSNKARKITAKIIIPRNIESTNRLFEAVKGLQAAQKKLKIKENFLAALKDTQPVYNDDTLKILTTSSPKSKPPKANKNLSETEISNILKNALQTDGELVIDCRSGQEVDGAVNIDHTNFKTPQALRDFIYKFNNEFNTDKKPITLICPSSINIPPNPSNRAKATNRLMTVANVFMYPKKTANNLVETVSNILAPNLS